MGLPEGHPFKSRECDLQNIEVKYKTTRTDAPTGGEDKGGLQYTLADLQASPRTSANAPRMASRITVIRQGLNCTCFVPAVFSRHVRVLPLQVNHR